MGRLPCLYPPLSKIGKKSEAIYRPEKELKGFAKIYLEPGQSEEVKITFDDKSFRYFDVNENKFQVESGQYTIMIGASSRDIRLSGTLYIEGITAKKNPEISDKYFSSDIKNISDQEFEGLLGYSPPVTTWDKTKLLKLNDSLVQMTYAKSRLARLVIKILCTLRHRSFKKGKPDLNILFLSNMPFRAIGKMAGGSVSMEMVDGMLAIVNGRFFKGVGEVRRAFSRLRKRGRYDRQN